ncbi:MAG: hypothetical protein ACOWWM_14705 [Desulfobacterales bacterium]
MTLDLFKNKASGRYFIAVDEIDDGILLMITPDGDLKPLEQRLFIGPEIKAQDDPEIQRLLNRKQIVKYQKLQKKVESHSRLFIEASDAVDSSW